MGLHSQIMLKNRDLTNPQLELFNKYVLGNLTGPTKIVLLTKAFLM